VIWHLERQKAEKEESFFPLPISKPKIPYQTNDGKDNEAGNYLPDPKERPSEVVQTGALSMDPQLITAGGHINITTKYSGYTTPIMKGAYAVGWDRLE
jgi:hypothetical protein